MKIITGNANIPLAEKIADHLNVPLAQCEVKRFADMEIFVQIQENVRCQDVFVIQSTSFPANDHLMELLIIMDALKRASAQRITAVVPYFGYARQDRKSNPRTPISAKLVADLITMAGANRIMTLDLHAGQIQGFFDVPADNLFAMPAIQRDILTHYAPEDLIIVSPDIGGVVRARSLAKRLNVDLAIVDKRREKVGVSEVMNIIGDVQDKRCLLIDDIIDSGGTICNAATALLERGARSVIAYVTHGVLSNGTSQRVQSSHLEHLIITNSICPTQDILSTPKIRLLDIAPLMAEAISRTVAGQSVSSLFN